MALLFGLVLIGTSCEDGNKNLTDQYATILYLNKSGVIDVPLYNTGTDGSFTNSVCKSGHDLSANANVSLEILTQEELDKYNDGSGTSFELLDEQYYNMPTRNFVFTGKDSYKIFDVTFKTGDMANDLPIDKAYVLPVRLSSANDSINADLNMMILRPLVETPKLVFDDTGIQRREICQQSDTLAFKTPVYLNIDNQWEFDVMFENNVDSLTKRVAEYNSEAGTTYQLLPKEFYKFKEKIKFEPTDLIKQVEVGVYQTNQVDNTWLPDGEYLLPIIVTECDGKPFDVKGASCYILLKMSGDVIIPYMYYVNSHSTAAADVFTNVFDGNTSTNWQSHWQTLTSHNRHPIHGVYIDMNYGFNLSKVKFKYTTSKSANTQPTHIVIYAGSSADDLTKIAELTKDVDGLPTAKETAFETPEYTLDKPSKFFRFSMLKSMTNPPSRQEQSLTVQNSYASVSMAEWGIVYTK